MLGGVDDDDDATFELALDVYVRSASNAIASMRTSLEGLDAIAFTGGAASSAPEVVALITERIAHLGIDVDSTRFDVAGTDRIISTSRSAVTTTLLHADENRAIADAVLLVDQ